MISPVLIGKFVEMDIAFHSIIPRIGYKVKEGF